MRFSRALLHTTFLAGALLGGVFAAGGQPRSAAPDPYKSYPANNWLNYSGSYNAQHYSALRQINTANAGKLVTQWVYHLPNTVAGIGGQEQTPIVYNGVMYLGMHRPGGRDRRAHRQSSVALCAPRRRHRRTRHRLL